MERKFIRFFPFVCAFIIFLSSILSKQRKECSLVPFQPKQIQSTVNKPKTISDNLTTVYRTLLLGRFTRLSYRWKLDYAYHQHEKSLNSSPVWISTSRNWLIIEKGSKVNLVFILMNHYKWLWLVLFMRFCRFMTSFLPNFEPNKHPSYRTIFLPL